MDRFKSILLVAGIGCFALAFVLSALYPYLITDARVPAATIEELAADVPLEFRELKAAYPVSFERAYPGSDDALTPEQLAGVDEGDPRRATSEEAWRGAYARALRDGRDTYIAEACWHCHSQYVRPVANESVRFGPVLQTDHDNNDLQRPQLWGTRRVGPDLTHEGRKRSNDWHVAHFWDPATVTPGSVMPRYRWFFRDGWQVRRTIDEATAERTGLSAERSYGTPGLYLTQEEAERALVALQETMPASLAAERDRLFVAEEQGPDGRALSLIAYLQWLGTWTPPHLAGTP